MRRAKDGDPLALAALCERHADRVNRIALHILRDPDDARDAAQESLVKLVQRVGQFRGQSQFSTWLHRLTVNTCKDVAQARWVAQRRTSRSSRTLARRATAIRPGQLAASETRASSAAALAELPAAQATVVALKDAFDVSFDDISAATGPARRHGQVLRAPRPQRARRAALGMTDVLLDRAAIEAVIPHRDPLLLIDEVIELVPGERVVARKTVTEDGLRRPLPRQPDHAGREDGRGARAVRRRRGALAAGEPRQARALRRHRRRAASSGSCGPATC